jgi:hypothetical protein
MKRLLVALAMTTVAIVTPTAAMASEPAPGLRLVSAADAPAVKGAATLAGFTWKNAKSNKCLDQSWANGSEHPDVNAISCNGGDNQGWYWTFVTTDKAVFQNAKSYKCLDQSWASGSEHPDVNAISCNGASNQEWYVYYNNSTGTYVIQNAKSGKCLDQSWANGSEHPDVNAISCHVATNQQWY